MGKPQDVPDDVSDEGHLSNPYEDFDTEFVQDDEGVE